MPHYDKGVVIECPNCKTTQTPIVVEKTTVAGWIVFGLMILFLVTIPWAKVGLNMKDRYHVCRNCGAERI